MHQSLSKNRTRTPLDRSDVPGPQPLIQEHPRVNGLYSFAEMSPHIKAALFGNPDVAEKSPAEVTAAYRSLTVRCAGMLADTLGLNREQAEATFEFFQPPAQSGRAKCLLASVASKHGLAFVKISGTPAACLSLQREMIGTQCVQAAGLQVPAVLARYREAQGLGVLATEFIGPERARSFVNTIAARAEIPRDLGVEVAKELLTIFKSPMPHIAAAGELPWVEPYYASIAAFKAEFEVRSKVLASAGCQEIADAVARDPRFPRLPGREVLCRWVGEAQEFLQFLDGAPSEAEVFCLGDVGPQNLFFLHPERPADHFRRRVVFFDHECVGKTPHWALSALADWGRFFDRTAPNVEVQREFLHTLTNAAPLGSPQESAQFLRRLILARLVISAHIAASPRFNPEWPRLDRLAALMESIGPSLAELGAVR